MTFPEFIEKKFVEWQNKQGSRKTVTDFAAYLGVSQPLVTMWMSGAKRPGPINIKLLGQTFGMEVYDALGLPRPEENLTYIQNHWDQLSPRERKAIRDTAEQYVTRNNKKG